MVYYRLAKDFDSHDVVVYDSPTGKTAVGRIIAKPGDTVEIDERGLKINGYYQTEEYIKGTVTVQFESAVEYPLTLKSGEYFILNDNRTQGGDSRIFGALNIEHICGKVVFLMRFREF